MNVSPSNTRIHAKRSAEPGQFYSVGRCLITGADRPVYQLWTSFGLAAQTVYSLPINGWLNGVLRLTDNISVTYLPVLSIRDVSLLFVSMMRQQMARS